MKITMSPRIGLESSHRPRPWESFDGADPRECNSENQGYVEQRLEGGTEALFQRRERRC